MGGCAESSSRRSGGTDPPLSKQAGEVGQEREVRFQPRDRVEILGGQPGHEVVGRAGVCLAAREGHRGPDAHHPAPRQPPIAPDPRAQANEQPQLLTELAVQGVGRLLAELDLAARQLPPAGQGRRADAPRRQQAAVEHDRRGDD